MNIKFTLFQGMSSWVQLLFLILFAFVGIFIGSFVSAIIAVFFSEGDMNPATALLAAMQSVDFLRISQFIQQIFIFLIPALLCAYLFNQNGTAYLKINKPVDIKILALAIILIFVVQPLISFTAYYNQQFRLPEFMSGIEVWMKSLEEANALLMAKLLSGTSVSSLLINLLIVAVMAGLVEEFFFRGSLQQIFEKIIRNNHVAVWVTAFIFSAIHMQFYGFVPRLLLGALLGYLFVWSGNLWIPVVVHFINNAFSVLLYRFCYGTAEYDKIENMGTENTWWLSVISLVLTVAILVYMSKEYERKKFVETGF
ncbi:MAG: lysostaphin resistance A-like protein [Dysgonomonas sp.]